jgi:hypothetical protein
MGRRPYLSGKVGHAHNLMVAGEQLGSAEWDVLPKIGQLGLFQTKDGRHPSVRSIDKIEDGPEGEKIVHLGYARPT